ncbi:MAG: hypothetical protein MUP71_11925, partial [Candidatus Aminicenantes bacterium]|nr:hypothetical protein [Candidatus Aminicenantes bacterium]
MKKTILIIALIGVFFGALSAQQITVTNPVQGSSREAGKLCVITWTKTGVMGDRVLIRLRNTGGIALDITLDTENNGLFCWTIPATQAPGQYYVRVKTLEDSAASSPVSGDSGVFTIIPYTPQSLMVNAPHGGENWEIGSTQPITWTALNIAANCRLLLLKNGQILGTIRDSFAPGQGGGSWTWKVGDYQGGPAPIGSGYKVRIQTVSGAIIYSAQSANSFTIIAKPIIFRPMRVEATRFLIFLPDLAVCLVWDGQRPYVQENKRIKVRVKNIGKGAAPATTCNLYVEGHGTRSIPVPALAANTEFIIYSQQFKWATLGHKTVRT